MIASRPVLAALAAGACLSASATAAAKGGAPAPAPDPNRVECDFAADTATTFSNQAGDGGCVTARVSAGGPVLERVTLTPGWTFTSRSVTGGFSLRLSNAATGGRVDVTIVAGKTVIK